MYIGLICLVLRETDAPELKEGLLSLGSEVGECFVFPLLIFWLTNCSEYFSSFFHRGGTEAESKTRWVKGWCSLHFRDESQARVVFEKIMERKAAAGDADVNIDADAQKTSSPRRHRFDFLTDSSKLFAPKALAKHQHIIFSPTKNFGWGGKFDVQQPAKPGFDIKNANLWSSSRGIKDEYFFSLEEKPKQAKKSWAKGEVEKFQYFFKREQRSEPNLKKKSYVGTHEIKN